MKIRAFTILGIITTLLLAGSALSGKHLLLFQVVGRRFGYLPIQTQPLRDRTGFTADSAEECDSSTGISGLRRQTSFDTKLRTLRSEKSKDQSRGEKLRSGHGPDQLHVEKVDSLDQLRKLEPDWNALHLKSGNTLPFATYAWAYNWWRYFREDRLAVRDSLSVLVVRNCGGEAVAIAPMMVTEHPGRGPLRIRSLQFLGADPNLTELRGPLLDRDHEGPALQAILNMLEASSPSWSWIKWSGLRSNSTGSQVIQQASGTKPSSRFSDYVLELPSSWDEFRKNRKRNIRESLRKCYNSLSRDGYEFTFDVAETPEAVGSMLDQFFLLHRQRAEEPGMAPHSNYFSTAAARSFMRDVCRDMAQRGRAKIFRMSIGGKVVAVRIGFVLNGSLYLYYSGYDPSWSRYSVMTTTLAEAIKYAISEGLGTVSLSTGMDVSKTRWGPSEVVYHDFLQRSPSPGARLVHRVYAYAHQVRHQQLMRQLAGRFLLRRSG